jgi:hypothetical protein
MKGKVPTPTKRRSSPAGLVPVPVELVERRIFLIRGHKVMLDSDLATLYRVETKRVNEAARRNPARFPDDFMFRLTSAEASSLRSQIATSNIGRGGRRYLPYAFTEHGVAMLSSVLNSERAVQMNILIIRAFVKLREMIATHKDLALKIEEIERTQRKHGKQITAILQHLIEAPKSAKRRFGFRAPEPVIP